MDGAASERTPIGASPDAKVKSRQKQAAFCLSALRRCSMLTERRIRYRRMAVFSFSQRTLQEPSEGKPGAWDDGAPRQPAAIIATA